MPWAEARSPVAAVAGGSRLSRDQVPTKTLLDIHYAPLTPTHGQTTLARTTCGDRYQLAKLKGSMFAFYADYTKVSAGCQPNCLNPPRLAPTCHKCGAAGDVVGTLHTRHARPTPASSRSTCGSGNVGGAGLTRPWRQNSRCRWSRDHQHDQHHQRRRLGQRSQRRRRRRLGHRRQWRQWRGWRCRLGRRHLQLGRYL